MKTTLAEVKRIVADMDVKKPYTSHYEWEEVARQVRELKVAVKTLFAWLHKRDIDEIEI